MVVGEVGALQTHADNGSLMVVVEERCDGKLGLGISVTRFANLFPVEGVADVTHGMPRGPAVKYAAPAKAPLEVP